MDDFFDLERIQKVQKSCWWYEGCQDMQATIDTCRLKKEKMCIGPEDCQGCPDFHSKWKPTNADKYFREASDKELWTQILGTKKLMEELGVRASALLKWLKTPADENAEPDSPPLTNAEVYFYFAPVPEIAGFLSTLTPGKHPEDWMEWLREEAKE